MRVLLHSRYPQMPAGELKRRIELTADHPYSRDRSTTTEFAQSYNEGIMEVRVPVPDYARNFA